MKHALIINLAIIALVGFTLWLTGNPMCLFGLLLLLDMPYGLLAQGGDEEDKPQGMGFTQDLDR
ncbi:hypothetical protein [Herbaspirillum huttiense]|uniref:Uncharacterized protein n=1 Tax=Herbaspirillum huttiense subsp. lycopersici TaxID=3074428 RepID=A0ABU2EFW6_9BURK|nr:hypothetical protein [Herbaspirillum huttiense]MDR9847039.1 hypothetical protein [Herbaspirillum huttiense SE1]